MARTAKTTPSKSTARRTAIQAPVGATEETTTPAVAPEATPEATPEAVVETPVAPPAPVLHSKYIGKLGTSYVLRIRPKAVNNILYNEVLTAEGSTFLLSDEDLKKQLKALGEE